MMHDFPINRCLRSFELVCEDRKKGGGGGLGKAEPSLRGCGSVWRGGRGQTYPTTGELYIFYSSSV